MEKDLFKGKPIFYKGDISLSMLKTLYNQINENSKTKGGINNYGFRVKLNNKKIFVKVTGKPSVFSWNEPLEKEFEIIEKLKRLGVYVPSTIGYVKIEHRNMLYGIAFYEYIDGYNLTNYLLNNSKNIRRFAENTLNELIIQISKIHALGIIHGDLHCGNIIVKDNKPFLIDFEMAEEFSQKNNLFWIKAYLLDIWKFILSIDRIVLLNHLSEELKKKLKNNIDEILHIYLISSGINKEIWERINFKQFQLLRALSPL